MIFHLPIFVAEAAKVNISQFTETIHVIFSSMGVYFYIEALSSLLDCSQQDWFIHDNK